MVVLYYFDGISAPLNKGAMGSRICKEGDV